MVTSDGSRGTLVIWVIAALVGGIALLRLGGCGDHPGGGSDVRVERSGGTAAHEERSADTPRAGIYVHVAGAVRQPGLLRVGEGARVAEAVERAGGPLPRAELSAVNLAAKLEDGQQVVVPVRGAVAGAAAGAAAAGPAAATSAGASGAPGSPGVPKLSLAMVTLEQLDELDGIGPTLAQRIVEYRTEQGGFRSLGELREVEGIGEKRYESLSKALQP